MLRVYFFEILFRNQTSKDLGPRIEYAFVVETFPCHRFYAVCPNENVASHFRSILEIQLNAVFLFLAFDKTMIKKYPAEGRDVFEKRLLEILSVWLLVDYVIRPDRGATYEKGAL